tara:strand:+ start:1512 stop:2270 length:759 start_codon:yes stop_codon:yes gene_type:complete
MKKIYYLLFTAAFFILSCNNFSPKKNIKASPLENSIDSSLEDNWVTLIQDNSMDGWHYYQDNGKKSGWDIKDGVLTFTSANAKGKGDKSLVSDKEYTNFKIHLEWKVSPGSNSGFFWGVKEDMKYEFPFVTGPEIQILDPEMPDGPLTQAGALYGMIAPSKWVTKPAGEWNSYDITIDHNSNKGVVVHNGEEIVSFPLSGEEWDAMVAPTKFNNCDQEPWHNCDFGKFKTGKISIQDHPGVISFRNIKILEL